MVPCRWLRLYAMKLFWTRLFARSSVIKDGDKKIGYIFLPEFYADLERPDGNRCSEDVANELKNLRRKM